MLNKKSTANVDIRKGMRGGPGDVAWRDLCAAEDRPQKCRVFAELTLEPGSGIGMHPHTGECEFFYVVSGTGTTTDDGQEYVLEKGDCYLTKSGGTHNLTNNGKEPLVVMALVVLD